ncbi:MAG: hypothetical protein EBW18_06315, partial [Burkholderiaceae bacterium]|nr:hypothetical protein [Burkholderiaceae bacterium]
RAGFVRNYCSPNVGNILIAGNLTKVIGGTEYNYPTTVRWSQAFASTGYPDTWEPTLSNVANEQEVPVRGPLIDGFFLGGNFYVCSYWDTVVFSPISYQNTTAPIFGVRLLNQGVTPSKSTTVQVDEPCAMLEFITTPKLIFGTLIPSAWSKVI